MKTLVLRLWAAACLSTLVAQAQQFGGLDINVRSGVDEKEQAKRTRDPAYAQDASRRARRFLLAKVAEETHEEKLVKPVDAKTLAKEVTRQLEAQGFHAVRGDEKPEMVITVRYGRGFPFNPYTDSDTDKQITNLSNSDRVEVWRMHDKYTGLEQKRQITAMEHLIIQVRAWEYPPPKDPKKREKLLWVTTMLVDDPLHRDLNEIGAKMLAAGAPYFDRHVGREAEVIVRADVPEGRVHVGTPEVVK